MNVHASSQLIKPHRCQASQLEACRSSAERATVQKVTNLKDDLEQQQEARVVGKVIDGLLHA